MDIDKYYRKKISVDDKINLKFQSIEWLEFNEKKESENDEDDDESSDKINEEKFIIRVFGVTIEGYTVCLNIEDFTPFFYVKIPETFNKTKIKTLLTKIKDKMKIKKKSDWLDCRGCIIEEKCRILKKKDFYGFNNNKIEKFLRIVFDNSDAMRRCSNIIKYHNDNSKKLNGIPKLPLYEANIDSIMKFSHIRDIKMSSWLEIDYDKILSYENFHSSCQIEATVKWNDVNSFEQDTNAPILQASYDIETYSHDGFFPKATDSLNVIFQIATSFKFFGKNEYYMKHIICLGKCPEIKSGDDTPIFIECYDTESEVLIAWKKLLNKMDPDVIYHYNGDGFDGDYLYTRANKILHCDESFLYLGKLKNIQSILDDSSFNSSAYGSSNFKRLVMHGRLNCDILGYMKREYNSDNKSFKLDDIAEKYLGKNKNPVTPKMIFEYYASGDLEKIKLVAEYCIQDTILPQDLVDKLHILQNLISMSNITYVPIKYIIEKGQQIKVISQILKETRKYDYLVPTIYNKDNEKFVGATVLTPTSGMYLEPITVCDFASLYPSIMIAHNLCYSSVILNNEYTDLPGVEYNTFEWEDIHEKTGVITKHKCVYVKNTDGVLPRLLSNLAKSRKKYKNLMTTSDDIFIKEIYNKCQLAIKVSMNSVYGFLASPMLTCKPIAGTVTYIGRNMIKETKDYIESNYKNSEVVYGDTDSVFVRFTTDKTKKFLLENKRINSGIIVQESDKINFKKLKSDCIKESMDLGKIVATNTTENLFIKPIKLEFEKVYCSLMLLSKKRYNGILYSKKSDRYDKIDNKGVVLARKDAFKMLKELYTTVLDILMEKGEFGVDECISIIIRNIEYIINNNIDMEDLIISKKLSSEYKNQNTAHLVLAKKIKQRNPGSEPKSNDRVPHVFIDINSTKKEPNYKKVEDPVYVKENNLQLDIEYYVMALAKPISEMLDLFRKNSINIFKDIIKEYKVKRLENLKNLKI